MDTNSRSPTPAPGLGQDFPASESARLWPPGIQDLLKVAAEKLEKQAKKAEKDFKAEKINIKQALKEENGESVRLYAENAIRMKNKWSKLNHWVFRANIMICKANTDGIVQWIYKELKTALRASNQQKVSAMMNRLEQLAQNLDMHMWAMEDSLSSATTLTTDQEQVERFLQEIAEEIELEEDRDQLSQLPKFPSLVGESSKGIGQD